MYKARDTANEGQMVALKKVRVPLTEEGVPMSTLREISLLKQMEKYEHPNIVRWVETIYCFIYFGVELFFFEWMRAGALQIQGGRRHSSDDFLGKNK